VCYFTWVTRLKRSISLPEELSDEVDAAAAAEDTTPSAWLAEAARRQLLVGRGLAAMNEWFADNGGPPTSDEIADADAVIDRILSR
jgi:predicted transcriptional regulator